MAPHIPHVARQHCNYSEETNTQAVIRRFPPGLFSWMFGSSESICVVSEVVTSSSRVELRDSQKPTNSRVDAQTPSDLAHNAAVLRVCAHHTQLKVGV